MKNCIFAITLALGATGAFAGELDTEATVSAQQVELAKDLPQTVVVRVSKSNPNDIEVAHLPGKLKAGEKVAKLPFEKMALNEERKGIPFHSSAELDGTKSTSSWAFGFAVGGRPWAAGWAGYRGGYGYNYGNNGYGYSSGYGNGCGNYGYYNYGYGNNCGCGNNYYTVNCYPAYRPVYSYSNYNYSYAPYYSYDDSYYNYAYCGWVY